MFIPLHQEHILRGFLFEEQKVFSTLLLNRRGLWPQWQAMQAKPEAKFMEGEFAIKLREACERLAASKNASSGFVRLLRHKKNKRLAADALRRY